MASLALHAEVAVGQEQAFSVNTRGAGGQGQLDVRMTSPSRRPIPCKLEPGGGAEAQAVRYMPPEEGPYKVDITYDGHPVPGSPFTVEGVLPPDPSKVRRQGLAGARSGFVGKMVESQGQRSEGLMSQSGHSEGPRAKAIPTPGPAFETA